MSITQSEVNLLIDILTKEVEFTKKTNDFQRKQELIILIQKIRMTPQQQETIPEIKAQELSGLDPDLVYFVRPSENITSEEFNNLIIEFTRANEVYGLKIVTIRPDVQFEFVNIPEGYKIVEEKKEETKG